MKRIAIADLHFTRFKNDEIINTLPERLHSLVNTLNYITLYAKEHRIKNIDIAGDIIDDKSMIYSIAQKLILDFFETNSDLNFTIIAGNHDMSDRSSATICALEFLRNVDNIHLITYKPYYNKDLDILYIPDNPNIVSQIKNNSAKILISHIGLSEAQLACGISITSDIKLSDLKRYKLVLLGHYHKPQDIKTKELACYYTGSVIQLDWNDANDPKRFLVYDTDTLEVDSIPTEGYKQFIQLEINSDNKQSVVEKAKQLKNEGHHVMLIKKEKLDTDDIEDDLIVVDKSEKELTDRGLSINMSQDKILEEYCKLKGVEDVKVYVDYLKSLLEGSYNIDNIGYSSFRSIKFENIDIENFMVFDSPMDLNQLDKSGLVIIGGKNGSGKSSLFEALYWCLYGSSPRGLRGDEIVNNYKGKNCSVKVKFRIEFENGQIDNYEIRRYYKHSKFHNKVFLIKNGKDITAGSVRETKQKIEQILVSEKVFNNCIFFAQSINDFFIKVPDTEKKDVLSKILDLDLYYQWKEVVKDNLNDLKQQQSVKEIEKESISKFITSIKQDLEKQKQLKEEFNKKKEDSIKFKKDHIESLQTAKRLLEESLSQFSDNLEDKINELKIEISNIQSDLNSLNEIYDSKIKLIENKYKQKVLEFKETLTKKKEDIIFEKQKQLDKLNNDNSINAIEINIRENELKLTNVQDKINNILNQIEVKENEFNSLTIQYSPELLELNNKYQSLKNEIDILNEELHKLSNVITKEDKIICPLNFDCPIVPNEKEILEIENKKQSVRDNIKNKNIQLEEYYNQIDQLKKDCQIEFEKRKQSLKQEIDNLKQSHQALKDEKDVINNYVNELKYKLKSKQNEINKLKQDIEREYGLKFSKLQDEFQTFKTEISRKLNSERSEIVKELEHKFNDGNNKIKEINSLLKKYIKEKEEKDKTEKSINDISIKIDQIEYELKTIEESKFDETQIQILNDRLKKTENDFNNISIELQEIENVLKISTFWFEALSTSGIISFLLDSAIPFINNKITYYLDILTGDKFTVAVDTLKRLKGSDEFRDKIDIQVINNLTKGNVVKMLSGGEVRVIDLCFMLTFKDLLENIKQVSFSCMFLDEILDALDEEVSKRVNRLLSLLSENCRVFLITHRLFSEIEGDQFLSL